ncbi:hypothetical protein GGQ80_002163 [Sphingomonas jinjuensis]|uniref:DUF218 domain-containing protein n=1 Tax=Sphingomonas jinjuensis TaxID=535907 RepID=A0A840F4L9_9SPHN|nr:hypothetical protein [Sphingomonas jinjuensis]
MIRAAIAGILLASSGAAVAASCPPRLGPALFPTLAVDAGGWVRGTAVKRILASRKARMAACRGVAPCVVEAAHWRDADRAALAQARDVVAPSAAMRLAGDSGAAAVTREIDGLDRVLDVYAGAQAPLYPKIDGPDDAAGSPARAAKVARAVKMAASCVPSSGLRDESLGLALALLTVNDRTEAIAFEPLDARHHAGAVALAKRTDWSRFPYTALIVPGIGPEEPGVQLSTASDANARMAADRYRRGLAPLIVVTGGSVHPRRTRFVEAVEIRRALVDRYGVPAEAVVIEPYARHTTTNLRNVTRRLVSLGVPLDRDTLIVTNVDQSRYIEGAEFTARNLRELGYQPGAVGQRVSANDLVFRPSPLSLRIDPADPLDP